MQYIIYIYNCASFRVCVFVLQMVWAETHRVGCALHLCSTLQGLNWDRASFLVCNYYPASVLLLLLSLLRTTTTNINTVFYFPIHLRSHINLQNLLPSFVFTTERTTLPSCGRQQILQRDNNDASLVDPTS